ncbi:MAG: hypothetical protein J6J05_02710 [Peptococcaceae bacterium]|nr:hypothetical protein [Peptococcaceae bacterium]
MTTETKISKRSDKRKRKLPLTAVLTYLIVVTLVATGVSLSAYVSTASGGDEARVAKFEIVVTDSGRTELTANFTAEIKPGDTLGTFDVENKSEVAVQYSAEVNNLTNNLPITATVTEGQSGKLQPGEKKAGAVTVRWNPTATDAEYMGKVDSIQIVITAEQID